MDSSYFSTLKRESAFLKYCDASNVSFSTCAQAVYVEVVKKMRETKETRKIDRIFFIDDIVYVNNKERKNATLFFVCEDGNMI